MQCKTERLVGDVVVLGASVRGLGDISTGLADRIRRLAEEGRTKFVLDLSEVSSLDSHGLGDLVAGQRAVARQGARVALCHVHPYVAEPLRIMNVDDLFDVFESEQDALQSFA
jgi:anti-sigma B factor antagonist